MFGRVFTHHASAILLHCNTAADINAATKYLDVLGGASQRYLLGGAVNVGS